jgi:hypothetical protein
MREKLSRRLVHLEQLHAAAMRAQAAEPDRAVRPRRPTAAQIILVRLGLRGFFPIGNESWAETTARAFGMTSSELRSLLAGPAEAFNAKLDSL